MSKNYCSPSKNNNNNNNNICYDRSDLIAIAKAYNNTLKKKQNICNNIKCISIIEKKINVKLNTLELHQEITSRLQEICSSDICWSELDFIKSIKDRNLRDSILYFTFKPKSTKNTNTWFNTTNINQIIDQYQELYKETFTFLGAQPSDFSKIVKVNWSQLKKINNIAIIFNTDNHLQSGKHWLSVFIDNVNKKVDYFDSLGDLPNKNITSFLKHFKNYTFKINKTEHQKKNSECGVYSCYFIIQRLKGLSFEEITNRIITDKMMTDYRSFLFRPNV